MRKSIRYTFFTTMGVILVSSVMVIGLIQSYLAVNYFRNENQTQLQSVVDGVARGARQGEIDITQEDIYTINYMAHIAGATVFVADSEGRITFCTDSVLQVGQQVSPKVLENMENKERFTDLSRMEGLFDSNQYIAAARTENSMDEVTGYVFAVTDASSLTVYLSDIASSFLLSAALVLLVASAIGVVLTNHILIPIGRISDAARKFGEGDYSVRVPEEGDNELSQLAVTFNEMANSFEATDTSRRSFMGNIAHELRTPMTTIKGFIDGMLDGTIPEELQPKYLAIVSEEVGRLARLTKNMLDISKLEAGEYTPQNEVFNVWEPLASVLMGAEQRIKNQGISVKGLENSAASAYIMGDEDFVHQILFNLVDNAIKFAGENGLIEVDVIPARGHIEVCIRNTGDGIAADVLPYLFERFYKVDKSRGLNAKGSGLGLHICKVLVNLMGGRIWAESEEGEWTEFHFTVPAATTKQIAAKKGGSEN